MSDWVVIYSGGTVTSTVQEKCNLENILWLNVDESCAEPSELNYRSVLFILNKSLLSFVRKRQNHTWMKFLDAIAEKEDSCNNLSIPDNLHACKHAVVFSGLTGEDLEYGNELFEGFEKIHLSPGQGLDILLMQELIRGSGSITRASPNEGATDTLPNGRSECLRSDRGAVPPYANYMYGPSKSTLCQYATKGSGQVNPLDSCGVISGTETYSRQGATGQMLSGGQEHSIAHGYGSASSYVMGYTSELDATRSLSSCGLAMGPPQSIIGLTNIHTPSHMLPATHQVSVGDSKEMTYIPMSMAQLRIGMDDQDMDAQDMDPQRLSHQCDQHVQQSTQPFNITPDRSLEDNNVVGVSPALGRLNSCYSGLGTEGGACHVDPKPSYSWTGDKASGFYDDDSLVIDLPVNVMQYLTSEMDIGPNYGKGWTELAALKKYVHSRVNRIKGNHSIQSPFQYLLGQQEFSGYTYGQLKRDLEILPRLDILRRLHNGNFI